MKIGVFILVLFFLTGILAADTLMTVGFGCKFMNQTHTINGVDKILDFASLGINVTGFYGQRFGLLTIVNFLFLPLGARLNEQELVLSDYSNKMALDLIFGLGYRISFSERFKIIFGGGLHCARISLIPFSITADSFGMDFAVGTGAAVSANIYLFKHISLYVLADLAYDFLGISLTGKDGQDLERGLCFGASGGLGISY